MTGNKKLDIAIWSLSIAATLTTLSLFIYKDFIFKKALTDNATEQNNLLEDSRSGLFAEAYQLKKLIINLKSRTRRLRFLDVQIHLVPFKSDKTDIIEENTAQINDTIIDIVGRMEPNELNSIAGKIILESRIKKGINRILHGSVIKEIFFSKFVVQ